MLRVKLFFEVILILQLLIQKSNSKNYQKATLFMKSLTFPFCIRFDLDNILDYVREKDWNISQKELNLQNIK